MQPKIIKIKPMQKKWTRETIFEESKRYSSRSEFKKGTSAAFSVAYKNRWLDEMEWLVHPSPKPIKWNYDAVIAESKKYSTKTDFMNNNISAYTVARKNGWLVQMDWLAPGKHKPSGFWKEKDNVIEESRRYKSFTEFRRKNSHAFDYAKKYGWLDEMIWLEKSNRKSAGYWKIKDNVFEESHNYSSRKDFCDGCYLAYITAKENDWLKDMVWLSKSKREDKGYWNIKENVFTAAKKCTYKSEFQKKYPGAYASARLHGWLGEMKFIIKESQGDPRGPIHYIYVYEDNKNNCAYVGATNNIQQRDYQHRTREDDAVYKHFISKGIEIPKCKVLREGLTIVERQREERLQSLRYRDILHYTLINNINLTGVNVGSLGSLIIKWNKKAVIREAEKYKTPTEFFTNSAGAYDAALKFKMMNKETFPWFYSKRQPPRWWNVKEHVLDESKKYKTLDEFFWQSPAAHFAARKHKWIDEMVWLQRSQTQPGHWQIEENVIEESKKYSTKTAFHNGCHAAYDYASTHNLWDKMPWIQSKVRENGYWTKERVFEEGAKYSTRMEFKKNASTAYSMATRNNWIEEMTWLVSPVMPTGHWQNKQNVIQESKKYSSRSEFRWGTPGAYRSAIDNGWIDEMTWLKRPQNYNLKWTRESVFEEAKKYETGGAFKKGCPSAYKVANSKGWLVEMVWLKIRRRKK